MSIWMHCFVGLPHIEAKKGASEGSMGTTYLEMDMEGLGKTK